VAGQRIPLREALSRYWPCLAGLATVPPVAFGGHPHDRSGWRLVEILFFASVGLAIYTWLFRRAPCSFWLVEGAVYTGSGLSTMLVLHAFRR